MNSAMLQSIVNTSTSYVILKEVSSGNSMGNEEFDDTLKSLIKPVKSVEASLSTIEKPHEKNSDAQIAFNMLKLQNRFS
ncbi:MAG: hypothetical protein ATN32_01700 [Candidatus Epulonipiscium fishelsonii]|nr:MAG: hypothetical protein ATN32_01700 [Epulopiscium sp. AS2M-Bin002]